MLQGRRYRDEDNAVDEDDDGPNSPIWRSRQESKASFGNQQSHRSSQRRRGKPRTLSLKARILCSYPAMSNSLWVGTEWKTKYFSQTPISVSHVASEWERASERLNERSGVSLGRKQYVGMEVWTVWMNEQVKKGGCGRILDRKKLYWLINQLGLIFTSPCFRCHPIIIDWQKKVLFSSRFFALKYLSLSVCSWY